MGILYQPDPEKAAHDEAAEKEILSKVKAGLTDEDLAELARATQELRLKQETPDPPEALKAVPSLSLQDIPKEPIRIPTEVIIIFLFELDFSSDQYGAEIDRHMYAQCRLVISMEWKRYSMTSSPMMFCIQK